MANVSLRLTEEEKSLIEAYAKLQGISVSEVFKKTVLERIEDEYDIAVGEKAYAAYLADGKQSRPFRDFISELENE